MKKLSSICFLLIAMLASFSIGAMGINALSLAAEIDVNPIAYAVPPALTLISAFVYAPTQNMLMCVTTAGIVHNPCQSNMPGVKLYGYFFLHDDVDTWPTLPTSPTNPGDSKELVGDIVMKVGKQMYPLYVTPDTGEVKSELQGERDCRSWKNTFEAFTPGMNNTQKEFADYLRNANVCIIQEDNSGVTHLIGYQGAPAYVESASIYTGKEATGKRGIDMVFSVNQETTPMTYNGVIQLTPTP